MNIRNKLYVLNKCLRYKFWKERTPLLVSLSVTGRCNLKCPYCYINVSGRKPTEPTLETLYKYVDDFYRLGTRIFFLQGGEPLLRNDIVDLASYIKAKGCYCSVTTNGTIHKPIPHLKILDHLEFSLDGPPKVNDKTRGKGVFQKTVQAAKIAKKCDITFHFHTVLSIHNLKENDIKYVANLAKSLDTYMTACFAATSGYENTQKFMAVVSDDKEQKGYRMLIRLKKEGYPIYNSFRALNHAINWPLSYNQIGDEKNLPPGYQEQCFHGRLAAWHDHEGWLYPCPFAFGREDFRARINQGGVAKAWQTLANLKCKDCGIASELPFLFGLRLENLLKIKKY